jgi:DNA-binding transcriptional ArsR family regulator
VTKKNIMELAKKQSVQCRALANARRLVILWALAKKELSVKEITEQAGSSLQNVSQHLSYLKKSGIVTCRRQGQTIFYQLVDNEYIRNCPAFLLGLNVFEDTIDK